MVPWLKAIYFWSMAVIVTAFFFVWCAAEHLRVVVLKLPRDGRRVHNAASRWGRTIIKMMPGWKLTVEGRENLPSQTETVVIVANHESMSDICATYHLGLQFRWLSKEGVFKVPGVGQAMYWAGYVPVRRGVRESHAQAMVESGERLRNGISMFFFPEGTRSMNGQVKAFKNGAFKLARDAQVRVLPVAIHGAGDLLPKGKALPGKAHVQIKILPLVPPPSPTGDLDEYAAEVRERIIKAHATLV